VRGAHNGTRNKRNGGMAQNSTRITQILRKIAEYLLNLIYSENPFDPCNLCAIIQK
jgi:hypothetical protein